MIGVFLGIPEKKIKKVLQIGNAVLPFFGKNRKYWQGGAV